MVTIEDIPYVSTKNSADMYLSTAALSSAYENDHFTHFAFLATDKDYIPLYNKLRQLGKTIIVISIDADMTSAGIVDIADQHFYYERLLPSVEITSEVAEKGKPSIPVEVIQETDELPALHDLLIRACKELESEGKPLLGAAVAAKMKQLCPKFNFMKAGFKKFGDFLASAEGMMYIKVKKHSTGDVDIVLKENNLQRSHRQPVQTGNDKLSPCRTEAEVGSRVETLRPEAMRIGLDREIASANAVLEDICCDVQTSYHEILKRHLKISMLPSEQRRIILKAVLDVFQSETYLKDLSKKATNYLLTMPYKFTQQYGFGNIVYKTLLTLYFGRAFGVTPNEYDKNNPLLWSIKYQDLLNLEIFFNKRLASIIRHTVQADPDPAKLSKALYDDVSAEHCRLCREIINELRDE
jgi:hypothetical protein